MTQVKVGGRDQGCLSCGRTWGSVPGLTPSKLWTQTNLLVNLLSMALCNFYFYDHIVPSHRFVFWFATSGIWYRNQVCCLESLTHLRSSTNKVALFFLLYRRNYIYKYIYMYIYVYIYIYISVTLQNEHAVHHYVSITEHLFASHINIMCALK